MIHANDLLTLLPEETVSEEESLTAEDLLRDIEEIHGGGRRHRSHKQTGRHREVVFRHGKRITVIKCPLGQKLLHGKCVKESPKEIRNRRRGSKKGLSKRRAHSKQALRSRRRSLQRRHRAGF